MIIECVGLPGSGKTSLSRAVASELPLVRSVKILKASKADVIRHPAWIAAELARWAPFVSRWKDKQACSILVRRRISQDRVVRRAATPLLLEEGVAHHVWRELFIAPDLLQEPWQRLVQQDHPLLCLEADRDTLHSRVSSKQDPPPVNAHLATESSQGIEWDRAVDLYQQVVGEAARARDLIRVDTSGGWNKTVALVLDALLPYIATNDQ